MTRAVYTPDICNVCGELALVCCGVCAHCEDDEHANEFAMGDHANEESEDTND